MEYHLDYRSYFDDSQRAYSAYLSAVRRKEDKKGSLKGVPAMDYKKTKNILMGTPARESVKRVQKNLSSFLLFSAKE